MFLSCITVNCIFLFSVAFVIIIVYNEPFADKAVNNVFCIRRRTKMSKAISRRDFLKVTGAVGAAGLLAACGGSSNSTAASSTASSAAAAESVAGLSTDPVTLTMSWWGGESRHNAYQDAIKAFSAEHTTITVNPTFAAWSGWEDTMSTKFAGGVAEDVCQINWNWLYNYSGNGQTFMDLNSVTDYLDLTQWDDAKLAACNVANAQQCVPVSMTGRIFYWNMTTFNKAGITEVPKTLDDLMNAGKAFKEKLGDDYYPLHLGAYDRMILMVFYLESKYGKDWADPTTSTLNYTADEIAEGIDFIKSLVDGHVIMSLPTYYGSNGDNAAHQSNEWITGKMAGIFEWDSSASKFEKALNEGQEFFVGNYFADMGEYHGGFTKVSLALAISNTAADKNAAAQLIEFLLNSDEGAKLMKSERGIPLSKKANELCAQEGLLNAKVAEANAKVLDWCSNKLDPKFESSALKSSDGVYYDVMDGLSYKDYSIEEAAQALCDGITEVLAK